MLIRQVFRCGPEACGPLLPHCLRITPAEANRVQGLEVVIDKLGLEVPGSAAPMERPAVEVPGSHVRFRR